MICAAGFFSSGLSSYLARFFFRSSFIQCESLAMAFTFCRSFVFHNGIVVVVVAVAMMLLWSHFFLSFYTVVCYPILRLVLWNMFRIWICWAILLYIVCRRICNPIFEYANGVSFAFIFILVLGRPRRSQFTTYIYFIFASFILQSYVLVIDLVGVLCCVFFSAKLG